MPVERFRGLTPAQERAFERIAAGYPYLHEDPAVIGALLRDGAVVRDWTPKPGGPLLFSPSLAVPDSVMKEYREHCTRMLTEAE
jgi:hypothetical protein